MKFLIVGDIVINQSYNASDKIDKSIVDLFAQSDCNIVNLEAPVTDSENKILKTGPHLKSDKQSTLNIMKKLNVHIAALANNHIKDYDEEGVLDTINFCENNGIETIGAGANIKEASETTVLNTLEGKIAIINIAENEWSSADENAAGANGMNIIKDTKKIQQAKKENNFVFVIIHGGHEYYNLPSPRMQEQYRFYAEQGADLVVGHHTHCISGYEVYNGTPIYYSLGNFLFTKNSQKEDWYTGLILEVKVNKGTLEAELHPVRQTKEGFRLSLLKNVEKKEVLRRVEAYSDIIKSEEDLIKEWHLFVISKQKTYLNYWSPKVFIKNKYVTGVLNRLNVKLINTRGLTYFLNLMRCEAHYDLSKAIISEYLDK
ncbi:CapA family protein [Psychrobacter sp. Ps5]|nr:CapA family protein [Psychrobacter sp. Ps5]MCG3860920.1 CapA family protein [Psychrobacter sp. Ps5]